MPEDETEEKNKYDIVVRFTDGQSLAFTVEASDQMDAMVTVLENTLPVIPLMPCGISCTPID